MRRRRLRAFLRYLWIFVVAIYATGRGTLHHRLRLTLRASTIARRLASVTAAHHAAGFPDSPAATRHFIVDETLKGMRRTLGIAQTEKSPLLATEFGRLCSPAHKNCSAAVTGP